MEEQIKRILRKQIGAFIALWALPAVCVFLYETGVFAEGIYAGDAQTEYVLQMIGILLTCGLIPFSMRMFNLNLEKRVRKLPLQQALKSYSRWSDVRLGLLFVPALLNLQFYYLTLNTTGIYCAAMALTASLFCVPSKGRIVDELDLSDEGEENA